MWARVQLVPGRALASSSHEVRSRARAAAQDLRAVLVRSVSGYPLVARLIARARAAGSPGERNAYRLGAVAAQLARGRDGAAPRAATRTA